jgi:hypothetical protein
MNLFSFLGENSRRFGFYRGNLRLAYLLFSVAKIAAGIGFGLLSIKGFGGSYSISHFIVLMPWGIFSLLRSIIWQRHDTILKLIQWLFTCLVVFCFAILAFKTYADSYFALYLSNSIAGLFVLTLQTLHVIYEWRRDRKKRTV